MLRSLDDLFYQGLQKHESERLPYVFVIVGVPGLTGASVGAAVPEDLAHLAFARNYRNAELDMHFSLAQDLTPLKVFLASARERGLHGLAVDLERGVL